MNKPKRIYMAYEGDKFLFVGNVEELAKYFNVKKQYIWKRIWEQNNRLKEKERKITFYELEEDEDDR